jgi:hypothetical protein
MAPSMGLTSWLVRWLVKARSWCCSTRPGRWMVIVSAPSGVAGADNGSKGLGDRRASRPRQAVRPAGRRDQRHRWLGRHWRGGGSGWSRHSSASRPRITSSLKAPFTHADLRSPPAPRRCRSHGRGTPAAGTHPGDPPGCAGRYSTATPRRPTPPVASSTTENAAVRSDGSPTANGDPSPTGMGRHARVSARDRPATSSYSSECNTPTSACSRARNPIRSPRSTRPAYHPTRDRGKISSRRTTAIGGGTERLDRLRPCDVARRRGD